MSRTSILTGDRKLLPSLASVGLPSSEEVAQWEKLLQGFRPKLDGWHEVGRQFEDDLRGRAVAAAAQRQELKATFSSVAEFETYRDQIRAQFLKAIGGLPEEKTPLRPKQTGCYESESYRVERVIFESLPNFPVSALCYIPNNLSAPAPTVLFLHGHNDDSKSYAVYQSVCLDLVENGFVVLAMDPVGQGERKQYPHPHGRGHVICTVEHTRAGVPFWLQGKSIARHFIWDAMRAIDYLETRAEVDASRIGVTGNSGGGTQSSYLMLLESRLAAAAPCTFIMTLESMMRTGLFQDAEQIIPGSLVHGPDHDDYLAAMAPRPVMVGAALYDMFPIEGTVEAVERARRGYELYGCPDNLELVVDRAYHSFSRGLRQATVRFFLKHLAGVESHYIAGPNRELPRAASQVSRTGQLATDSECYLNIFDINRQLAVQTALERRQFQAAPLHEKRARLWNLLSLDDAGERRAPIYERVTHTTEQLGYRAERIWFFSSHKIAVSGTLLHPRASLERVLPATILLLENGTSEAVEYQERICELLQAGRRVFVFDVRGSGGVAPSEAVGEHLHPEFAGVFTPEYKWGCDAMLLGLSSVGLRVFDVLRGFDYLRSRTDVSDIDVHGVGSGAAWALFSAALEDGICGVTCESFLSSFESVCQTKDFALDLFNLKSIPWGILEVADISDLTEWIAPRPVRVLTPVDAEGIEQLV